MSVTAQISSSLSFANGAYFQAGLGDIPITVKVYNSSSSPVQINQIILSQQNLPVPTQVGTIGIIRNNIVNTANNTVPAATTITVTGTVPIPSGSGDPNIWVALPFQTGSEYTLGSPPIVLGPFYQNYGFYGLDTTVNPPLLVPVYKSDNNASIINVGATPIFSGAVNLTQALNFTSSVYSYDPEVSQGGLFGILQNASLGPPPTSSLCNEFTYEWWSNLRSYGVPNTGTVNPTNNAGTIWDSSGFLFLEGAGAQIGYLVNGKLYIMLKEDFLSPLPTTLPPYVGLSSSATVPLSTWIHQAVTRNSAGQVTFWIDGTGSGGGSRPTGSNPHYFNNFHLFGDAESIPFLSEDGNSPYESLIEGTCDGYFLNAVFSNYCKYTGNFTPPTGALSAAYGSGGGNIPVTSSQTTLGSASYNARISPQTDAIYYFPSANNGGAYNFNLQATVQIGKGANFITASQADFTIYLSQLQTPSINSPYRVWSLFDDRAPPFLTGSDFIIQGQILTAETPNQYVLTFPPDFVYFSSSDNSIATVIENGIGTYVTGSTGNPQLSGSGGSVKIMGQTGSVIISMAVGDPNSPPAAELELTVIDAYPLTVSTFPQQAYGKIGADLQLRAYLSKTNGSNTDITNDPLTTWSVEPSNFATITNGLLSISSPAVGEASPAGQVLTVSAVYNNSFRELLGISQVIVRN